MKTPGNGQTSRRPVMSEDSPASYNQINFERKETAVNPPINEKRMLDKAVQLSPNDLDETTSTGTIHKTLAAQELNHSFQIQHCPANQPTPNRRSLENEEAIEKADDIPLSIEVQAKSLGVTDKEISHETDKTDGNWPTEDQKPDESCGVQCLYCIMQCCDCTIL
ncbi:uncharacterized protein LOC111873914 isoform X2 [Cryptotermes secundus]|uniref:uncharacterized protein LOC111873914 isoform X2 n=1 Tax=Cryptotermes secundus TaxID=105785 RepID=UPI000CD7B395|nr:uncharacterized protein LOC111873914 isoform X2 [Cryptotermes secundus]